MLNIAGLFSPKLRAFLKVRNQQELPSNLKGCIWMHCASLGEFEQGRPILETIKSSRPETKIVLSFFSNSGYNARKNYHLADWVGYLPMDTKKDSRLFVNTVQPAVAIFVKYEFWFNHLDRLITSGIPFIFVSSYWWKGHFLLQPWNKWLLKKVIKANALFVQDQNSKVLLDQVGCKNAIVAGDTRIDRVLSIKKSNESIPFFQSAQSGIPIFIAGSSWWEDETIIKEWYDQNQNFKLIIVPHDVSPYRIQQVMDLFKEYSPIQYTDWEGSEYNVMIVNKIGILNKLYSYATIAYIGGGFGRGIHNILEPAVYGIPVVFGPNFTSFKEATDMIGRSIAFSINNVTQLIEITNTFSQKKLERIKKGSEEYINENKGATDLIIKHLFKLITS